MSQHISEEQLAKLKRDLLAVAADHRPIVQRMYSEELLEQMKRDLP